MFLNYIGLLYIWKIVIASYIDLSTGHLQKFQYINVFCLFSMTQIGTKFWYVFQLHRSDLHTKISHRIQHIFFKALQKFEYINIYCSFLITQIGMKFFNRLSKGEEIIQFFCTYIYNILMFVRRFFLMSRISTKFQYVFKLYGLHIEICPKRKTF